MVTDWLRFPLHGISTPQRFSLWCLGNISTGGLDSPAGFGLDFSALSVLAEGLVGTQFGDAFGIAFGVAILSVRFDLFRCRKWEIVKANKRIIVVRSSRHF